MEVRKPTFLASTRHFALALVVFTTAIIPWGGGSSRSQAQSETAAPVKTVDCTFKTERGNQTSRGECLVKYADGSLLLLTPDGQLYTLRSEEIVSVEESTEAMQALTSEEIFEQFKSQLDPGFLVYKTRHYVIVYNTSEAYARWAAELFERLYRGFYNYWKSQRVDLEEPRFPLVAVVFRDKASYLTYAEREVGEAARAMIGHYNMKTNRMTTYDLTGIDGMVPQGTQVSSSQVINQILAQPQAERTVATIVHEAVHQLAFNSGLQVRLADNPLWLSEGLAMFFESPDVGNAKGWGTIGKVNYHNLRLFAQYLPSRTPDSLSTLLTDDSRLRDSATAAQAYSESWAVTYFLMKTQRKEFSEYLKDLAKLPPLGDELAPRERLDMFKKHFGDDLKVVDAKFLKYIRMAR